MYEIMKKFFDAEGHSLIPTSGRYENDIPGVSASDLKVCGRFVSYLRTSKRKEGEERRQGKIILPFMAEKLKEIEFVYRVASNENTRKYTRLVYGLTEFKKENGHCNVRANHIMPEKVPELLDLCKWIRSTQHKAGRSRLSQLQTLGFSIQCEDDAEDTINCAGVSNEVAFERVDEEEDTNLNTTAQYRLAPSGIAGSNDSSDGENNASELADGSIGPTNREVSVVSHTTRNILTAAVCNENEASSNSGTDDKESNMSDSDRARIHGMTVPKLKIELRKYGLCEKGLKAVLRQRLLDHMSSTMPFNELDYDGK